MTVRECERMKGADGGRKRESMILFVYVCLCVLTAKSVKSRGIQSIPFRFAVNYVRQWADREWERETEKKSERGGTLASFGACL